MEDDKLVKPALPDLAQDGICGVSIVFADLGPGADNRSDNADQRSVGNARKQLIG